MLRLGQERSVSMKLESREKGSPSNPSKFRILCFLAFLGVATSRVAIVISGIADKPKL